MAQLTISQHNLIQAAHNREYRDNEQSKRWRLELYNALNGTSYTDPDALERKCDDGGEKKPCEKDSQGFEWTATVININPGHNSALQKNCKPLYDYVRYVGRITGNQKNGMPVKDAVDDAVGWAIEENLLMKGIDSGIIAECTGFTLEEVKKLAGEK